MADPLRGSITLELLIAFGILTISLSAAVLVQDAGSARTVQADAETLAIARSIIVGGNADTTEERNGVVYAATRSVTHGTRCMRKVSASVRPASWTHIAPLALVSYEADLEESGRLGGDCEPASSAEFDALKPAETFSFAASVTAMDAVGDTFYLGLSEEPYFLIYDDGWEEPSFSLPAAVNDIDAVHLGEERYVFATLATSTGQLAVIDVSQEPELIGVRSLHGVTTQTNAGHGGQVHYYDERLYVSNGYIIGAQPELHIFNAEYPSWIIELGVGTNINTTIRDLQVRGGLLYAATAHEDKELAVYDVSNAFSVPVAPVAVSDFGSDGGGDGGKSLALRGDLLYFGRASNVDGPELYIFDVSDLSAPLEPIGSGEVPQKDVSQIILDGNRAFLSAAFSATPSTRRIELWDIEDVEQPERIDQYAFPSMTAAGLELVSGRLWVAKGSEPALTVFAP